jgi:hypothetical protein
MEGILAIAAAAAILLDLMQWTVYVTCTGKSADQLLDLGPRTVNVTCTCKSAD